LTWATAKATVNAAVALVTAPASTIAVAPGLYDEVVNEPSNQGVLGAENTIFGDTYEQIFDSGGNTHGHGIGHVLIYRAGGNPLYWISAGTTDEINYWDFTQIVCWSGSGVPIGFRNKSNGTTVNRLHDCMGWGLGNSGVTLQTDVNDNQVMKAYRCVGIANTNGFYCATNKTSPFTTVPTIFLHACVGIGAGFANSGGNLNLGLRIGGSSTAQYTHTKLVNCAGFAMDLISPFSAGIGGFSKSYLKTNVIRNWAQGYYGYAHMSNGGTSSDNKGQEFGGGAVHDTDAACNCSAQTPEPGHVWIRPRLARWSVLRDALADFSGSLSGEEQYDIQGHALEQTIGPEEDIGVTYLLQPAGYDHGNDLRGMFYGGATRFIRRQLTRFSF
jgi:hypothetical protein